MSSYCQIVYHLVFRTKDSRKSIVLAHSRALNAYMMGDNGWADAFAALTYGWKDKKMIVNYIKNQQHHHKKESFEDELKRLLHEQGIEVNEKYFP